MSQRKYIVEQVGEYELYGSNEAITRLYVVKPDPEWDGQDAWDDGFLAEVEEDMSTLFPSEHCQHSYDCCGNWYPSRGYILERESDMVLVSQPWTLNV